MLTKGLPLGSGEGLGGKRLAGATALLHAAETVLDAFGERLASGALHTFHKFLYAAVRPDAETDGALGHPRWGRVRGC
jgi:hypothetical protein